MRTGWFREVAPRSEKSQALRALMVARSRLVRMRGDAQNQIRGLLKERGIRLPRAVGAMFRRRVREAMEGRLAKGDHLHVLIDTFLRQHEQLCVEQSGIERRIRHEAAADGTTRWLMTIPGVGIMTATCFRQTIDDPHRFTSSATVGVYLGLTPRRHQSDEMDWTGRISKRGSVTMRALLYEAATVIMHRVRRPCAMERWVAGLAERIGQRRAKVALARKLAVIMHESGSTRPSSTGVRRPSRRPGRRDAADLETEQGGLPAIRDNRFRSARRPVRPRRGRRWDDFAT
ncbi:MAG: IS110 family transposase [Pseudomonadota bacterium]